jgi:hypothetical protein
VPFDIGLGELIGIAIVALIVLGPEKLPRYAADASSLGDMNPRSLIRKHLLEPVDLDDLDDLGADNPMRRAKPGADRPTNRPASATGTDGPAATPRYDEDVT